MYRILNKLSYFTKNVSIVVLMICAGIILTGCDDSKEIMINEETVMNIQKIKIIFMYI